MSSARPFTKLEGISDLHAETGGAHEVVGEIVKQAHEFPLATLSAALQSSKHPQFSKTDPYMVYT
jgi:hypothetical protein